MNFTLKPNFRVLGPILGKDMGAFGKAVNQLDPSEVVKAFDNGEKVVVRINDERTVEVDSDQLVVNIISKEGFTVQMEGNDFIILDIQLTDELIQEGYAREFVSRVQQMRKSNDFDVSDHIKIYFTSTDNFTAAINNFSQYVMDETLAVTIESLDGKTGETHNLNGHETNIYLERIV